MKLYIFRIVLIGYFSIPFVVYGQKITPYEMYSDHFVIPEYAKQYKRSFDSLGIILQNKEYHPLTISIYAIMCHDAFIKTGDSAYFDAVVQQYIYFNDTTRLDYAFDNKGVGLPYNFPFGGMKPPWYSGLAQGVAVSFLLRYYALTKDEAARDLLQKIAYFMIQPVEKGGTISKTPEGTTWIEEYPNSRSSKNVLNGFINGLVGLKEYCDFFPEDTLAKRIHDESYESFVSTISEYDTPTWSSYNRNKKGLSTLYMRIQLTQMDHLYSLYNDERLRRQMMIWGMMMNNRLDKELRFYKKPSYIFSKSAVKNTDGSFAINEAKKFNKSYRIDSNVLIVKNNKQSIPLGTGVMCKGEALLKFDRRHVWLDVSLSKGLDNKKFKVLALKDGKAIAELPIDYKNGILKIKSDIPFNEVSISYRSIFKNKLYITNVRNYSYRDYKMPMFGHHMFAQEFTLIKGNSYRVELPVKNAYDLTLFYRSGRNKNEVKQKKWIAGNYINDTDVLFVAPQTGVYQFFVSYRLLTPNSSFEEICLYPQ